LITRAASSMHCWYSLITIHNMGDSSNRDCDILVGGDVKITLISFLTIAVCRVQQKYIALGARSR
jgi:hypothetical protein